MQITIVHKREQTGGEDAIPYPQVYIGRPSPLGNPFAIGRDGTRGQVIEQYDTWLTEQIATFTCHGVESDAVKEMNRLWLLANANDGLILVCWCKPKDCHGDVVKRYLDYAFNFKDEYEDWVLNDDGTITGKPTVY